MNEKQIHKLIDNKTLPDSNDNIELKETHISWVILTNNFAYKVKKPVTFSFLDFSTLDKREYYCWREIELNKRLAEDMYLDVIPITEKMVSTKNSNNEIIDYAVKMKRMDNEKEMSRLLSRNEVRSKDIENIAAVISEFHNKTQQVKNVFNTTRFQKQYKKLQEELDYVNEFIGSKWGEKIKACVEKSNTYLNNNRELLNERVISGFQKDCHGDLTSYNIFLYDPPVVFDCIEFNNEFRQIDVFNEIAFLCVDLDFFGKKEFSQLFFDKYSELMNYKNSDEEISLFNFYKSYRANIRAKVTILNQKQHQNDDKANNDIKQFIDLMTEYLSIIKT
ncbi:MAG: hypothetical protein ACLFVR_05880 [Thiohalospira sp.]